MNTTETKTVTELVRTGEGTQYILRTELLKPSDAPELLDAGFGSKSPLYMILWPGATKADYDKYRLLEDVTISDKERDVLLEAFAEMKEVVLSAGTEGSDDE